MNTEVICWNCGKEMSKKDIYTENDPDLGIIVIKDTEIHFCDDCGLKYTPSNLVGRIENEKQMRRNKLNCTNPRMLFEAVQLACLHKVNTTCEWRKTVLERDVGCNVGNCPMVTRMDDNE